MAVPDRFGTMVFSEDVMKEYLPKDIYKRLAATIEDGKPLDLDVANAVAHAMKEWAIEQAAPRTTRTGSSRFLALRPRSTTASLNRTTMVTAHRRSFRAKSSSRASPTHRASPTAACAQPSRHAVIPHGIPRAPRSSKMRFLCIPTAFMLVHRRSARQEDAASAFHDRARPRGQARAGAVWQEPPQKVVPSVGNEQEYFLIKKEDYRQRKDLVITGRTLFGAIPPARARSLRSITLALFAPRSHAFMKDLDERAVGAGHSCQDQAQRGRSRASMSLRPSMREVNDGD